MVTPTPPGVELSFKQLINAILFKCKYSKDQLSELSEAELSSLDRKLHIASSAILGCRNSTYAKINRLPPELLFNILSYAQSQTLHQHGHGHKQGRLTSTSFLPDLTAYEDHGRKWFSLLHVCRSWRGVIARSPMLWTTVDNTLIEEGVGEGEKYLYRSGAAPLTVYLGVKDAKIRRKPLEALLKHSFRFQEFHLIADLWEDSSSTSIYSLLVNIPAPILRSLTIRTDGKDIVGGVLPPIFHNPNGEIDGNTGDTPSLAPMPSLRELTLEHFTSWPSNYFHNLTSLSLSDQPFNRPTTLAFLDFLENSPMLEVLALVRAGPTLSDNIDVIPSPAAISTSGINSSSSSTLGSGIKRLVHFPYMRQLNLGGWPTPSTISRFLSYLSLPKQTDMYIWGSVFSNPDMDLKSIFPALDYDADRALDSTTNNLKNIEGITKWYLTHYSVAQPGDLLYVPFVAVIGSGSDSDPSPRPVSSSHHRGTHTPTSNTSANTSTATHITGSSSVQMHDGNALHTYGVFRSSQLLSSLSRYPLHNITLFVLRDSSYQANRFTTSVWVQIFGKMKALETLRILAYQSTTTTRSVLTALIPVPTSVSKEGENEDGGENDRDEPRSRSKMTVLCPNLSTLIIEHDPDLASIFITKLVKARKDAYHPISTLTILVYDPQYGFAGGRDGEGGRERERGEDPHHHHNGNGNTPGNGGAHPNLNAPATAHANANANANLPAGPASSSSSLSSLDVLNEEYHLRSKEDEELLRRYVDQVRFEYKKPLSMDLVPGEWPTDAYKRSSLPYSF